MGGWVKFVRMKGGVVVVVVVEPLTSCPHADPRSAVSSSPVTSCWSRLAEERASSTLKEKRRMETINFQMGII